MTSEYEVVIGHDQKTAVIVLSGQNDRDASGLLAAGYDTAARSESIDCRARL